jgi:GTPase SAR1 family protein
VSLKSFYGFLGPRIACYREFDSKFKALSNRPTIGCVIKVLSAIHELQGKYFIELWDLGGNPRFGDGRPIYYEDCDGYIFLW